MSSVFDNRLRPAFEFLPAAVLLASAALLTVDASRLFPLMPSLAHWTAAVFVVLGLRRLVQGTAILRYRARLVQLPHYAMTTDRIPRSATRLFLGRGFRWDQRHSQRLIETLDPGGARLLRQPVNKKVEASVGGNPCLHGVGAENEHDVWMDLGDRTGHTLVMGTTRVGKTRLAELLVAQDIRRGETVIVLDPKGDPDLLRRMYAEAKRAGRLEQFHLFHLGHPGFSERYNPIGEFGRITEVASRIAAQLPSQGDSAAFREFAWRFINIVARALAALGDKPGYAEVARSIGDVEPLLIRYLEHWLERDGAAGWKARVEDLRQSLSERPAAARGRDLRALALLRYVREQALFDPVAEGLRSAFEYDRSYFDKIVAGVLPLLDKLISGRAGALLAPDYADLEDRRPVLDWRQVIRERGIVYVGLDALSDPEVATAVGNSMFADLTSVAGQLYKFGATQGLPPTIEGAGAGHICLHADEFSELVGEEFIPLLNKGGGAGLQITAYTQTVSDIEAGTGSPATAGQVSGNLGTLIMLRVRNEETAELLTTQLPKVRVYTKLIESRTTDDNHPETPTDFTSANADRLSEVEAEMLHPSDLVQLPKGQAFALLDGGQLYKLRLPLPAPDPLLPKDLDAIHAWVRERWRLAA